MSRALIQAHCFDLNTANKDLKWDVISTPGNLKPEKLADALAEESEKRLNDIYSYYYSIKGEKRLMPEPEGRFKETLKNGRKALFGFIDAYPKPEPVGAKETAL